MGSVQAWNILGPTLTLGTGLIVIGWAKYKARLAHEEWERGDGPRNDELLEELHAGIETTTANLRAARMGMERAAVQVREEVR